MTAFCFDSATIAELTAQSRAACSAPPTAMRNPVLVDGEGYAWLPAPDGSAEPVGMYVHPGLRVGFIPVPEADGLLLIQWGGPGAQPGFEEEGVVAFLTRDGFVRLITDLQAIAAQLSSSDAAEAQV